MLDLINPFLLNIPQQIKLKEKYSVSIGNVCIFSMNLSNVEFQMLVCAFEMTTYKRFFHIHLNKEGLRWMKCWQKKQFKSKHLKEIDFFIKIQKKIEYPEYLTWIIKKGNIRLFEFNCTWLLFELQKHYQLLQTHKKATIHFCKLPLNFWMDFHLFSNIENERTSWVD